MLRQQFSKSIGRLFYDVHTGIRCYKPLLASSMKSPHFPQLTLVVARDTPIGRIEVLNLSQLDIPQNSSNCCHGWIFWYQLQLISLRDYPKRCLPRFSGMLFWPQKMRHRRQIFTPKHHSISRQELSETEEQLATVPLEDAQQAEGGMGESFLTFLLAIWSNLKHAHRPYYHITLKERYMTQLLGVDWNFGCFRDSWRACFFGAGCHSFLLWHQFHPF